MSLDYLRNPNDILREAHEALDNLGEVMARSAPPVAPDFAMRTAIAVRRGIVRHRINTGNRSGLFCRYDDEPWPCGDMSGYLSILGVHTEQAEDGPDA
jgi:hypothetical protein